MNITNYEQQLSQLTNNDKFKYIMSLSDENTKLSLLKYLSSDDSKEKVINTFTSEDLKLEAIKQLQSDSCKVKIISSLTNVDLIEQSLAFLQFDSNKVIVINSLASETDRLKLSSNIGVEWERIRVLVTITDDKLKVRALALLTVDNYKTQIISTISDENVKYELLSQINDDSEKSKIIETFGETLKIKSVELLKSDYLKCNIIQSISDENTKLSLLKYLSSDDYKEKVINTFTSEDLKLEAIRLLQSDTYKVKIISSLTNVDLIEQSLAFLQFDLNKVIVINSLASETDRLKLSSSIEVEWERIRVLVTITDDKLKVRALALLTGDNYKTQIISTISDENVKYELLSQINDDSEKSKIIETFGETLKIKSVELLKSDYLKCNIIQSISDENTKLSFLKKLSSDDYKEKVINTFTSEDLKLEAIKQLQSDSYKVKIISSLTNVDLIEQSLAFLQLDSNKVIVINSLASETDRLKLSSSIEVEWERIRVLVTITDDKLKVRALALLTKNDYKTQIISTISDENIKYGLLNQINDDSDKVTIISSFKNEDLLYNAISQLKTEYNKANVLIRITDDNYKYKFLSLIDSQDLKVNIINSISDNNIKINAINLLTEDNAKIKVINKIEDESIRVKLLSALEKEESKFLVIAQIKSNEIKVNGLKTINNYQEIMRAFFKKGSFEYLYHFDKNILNEVFDDNQIKILNEYSNIKNEKIRKLYSNYVSTNYENINMDNLDQISQILFRIEMSNSSELQAFGDVIANQVLNHDNPLQYFSQVEDIFVKNNIPYVGKIFEVFKLLHSNIRDYRNYSPLLNRFKDSKHQMQMMDLVIFNDLLKCAFGSNNRSLKEFMTEIDKGNNILTKVMDNKTLLNSLNESEKSILIKYLDRIEIILDSYEKWRRKKTSSKTSEELLLRINYIVDRLHLKGTNYKEIPDIIVRKLCGISGIDTFESATKYFEYIISEADKRNRERSNEPFILEEGDFVKGINDVKYLSRILQNGSVSKEFLGDSSNSDGTPLDTDLSRILSQDMYGKQSNELGRIIGSTISGSYGSTWFVLKNDPNRIEITRDSNNIENNSNLSPIFSKLEAFKTLQDGHYGIRTGFPTSEISYIVSRSHFDRIGLEIAMNGFYIPVVNTDGKLVFTPEDYDNLRSKMSGLSYYGENNYIFSDNLVNEDITIIAEQIEQSNVETKRKRDLINSKIKESLVELGLVFKDKIDGDLSEGTVELIDTGSTGRGTNNPGDGDFDFMMRLDKSILSNPYKMNELKKSILKKLGKENSAELTSTGDFRLKEVKIDDETIVDIDITFTGKTDKVSYSTDMCLQERLLNIYKQNPEQYNYVVANILLAKQVLKEGEVYKPNRGEIPQGGLGGVGIENWILQNGGSFIDAAKSFLDASAGKTFEEFKNAYYIWDFGENHMAEQRGQYSHDNFVSKNMSQSGYNRMIQVLNEFVRKYEYTQSDAIKR